MLICRLDIFATRSLFTLLQETETFRQKLDTHCKWRGLKGGRRGEEESDDRQLKKDERVSF